MCQFGILIIFIVAVIDQIFFAYCANSNETTLDVGHCSENMMIYVNFNLL